MEVVSSVRYRIKINNHLTRGFQPKRGLRQGDPISPYLFILCAEWLSRKISTAQASNMLRGIKVCRNAPPISHLFFADDSIFFMKATMSNTVVLSSILNEYQLISGQKINLAKSEIVFSRNVEMVTRHSIINTLGVGQVQKHLKYLRLPLVFGNSKSEFFKYLIERIWQKVLGWKEKLLSYAGKVTLIKSILMAIPLYPMMCFRIPKSVCKRITTIIYNY